MSLCKSDNKKQGYSLYAGSLAPRNKSALLRLEGDAVSIGGAIRFSRTYCDATCTALVFTCVIYAVSYVANNSLYALCSIAGIVVTVLSLFHFFLPSAARAALFPVLLYKHF